MSTYEIINSIISGLGLISIILIIRQLRIQSGRFKIQNEQLKTQAEQLKAQNLQIKADHERTRRQMTIDLMMRWTETINSKSAIARKIVEDIDYNQCEKIYNIENASIPKKHKTLLSGILEREIKSEESQIDYIKITDYESSIIRGLVLNYLNSLESILTGWRLAVSDKEIIEEEFSYLYDKEKNSGVLDNFRAVTGVHNYPSIKSFCDFLQEQNNIKVTNKEKIA